MGQVLITRLEGGTIGHVYRMNVVGMHTLRRDTALVVRVDRLKVFVFVIFEEVWRRNFRLLGRR